MERLARVLANPGETLRQISESKKLLEEAKQELQTQVSCCDLRLLIQQAKADTVGLQKEKSQSE